MSRTTRNFGHHYADGGRAYHDALARHSAGVHPGNWWSHLFPGYDFRKSHVHHGRDGAIKFEIGGPCAHSPDCFNPWDETWGMYRKRRAKRQTQRLRRLRGEKIIREALHAEGSDEDQSA